MWDDAEGTARVHRSRSLRRRKRCSRRRKRDGRSRRRGADAGPRAASSLLPGTLARASMAKKRPAGASSKKLEHLPLISSALERLQVRKTIDELVPSDRRQVVTTGQCVEALVVAILTG